MSDSVIPLICDVALMSSPPNPYEDQGFDGDATTAEWLLHQASRLEGAIGQAWKLRLAQGEILTQVRDRVPGFFDRWLEAHWPQMSRTTVFRLMATWEHREALSPFVDDDEVSRVKHGLPINAVDTIAMGGAIPEVVDEVLRRLHEGGHITPKDVADLNRQAKAKRDGKPAPRQPRPAEAIAVGLIRKGDDELQRLREALALTERASIISADAVLEELRLRQLPKGLTIYGADADFHRLRDGQWIRLPHDGMADVSVIADEQLERQESTEPLFSHETEAVTLRRAQAAEMLGVTPGRLTSYVSRANRKGQPARICGHAVKPAGRGMFHIIPIH